MTTPAPAYCDLHAHSTASDGTVSPAELAELAHRAGLSALSLTDHDTVAGLAECGKACQRLGLAFVPGIEVSAQPPSLADHADPSSATTVGTLHLLGYFIQPNDPGLHDAIAQLQDARQQRNPHIIEKLQELGVAIDYDQVVALAQSQGSNVVGRPHIAQVLIDKGYVKSMHEAFRRYIGQGAPAYVRKDLLAPADVIATIHRAGGLAVLAHPVQLRMPDFDTLAHQIVQFKKMGLDGLEVRHCDHTPADVRRFEALAKDLDLLTTGGSDYHGPRKPIELGSQRVPMDYYHRLREAHEKMAVAR
ncbi:MAG: PHP domain-containing protein [Phycisphaeraceae bacterium]|nr:PHP domain-containing protein [Phycisphaeraceae bacterium]